MKKRNVGFVFFALILAIIFTIVFGACSEQGEGGDEYGVLVDGKRYKIGDEGQAGGIVFYVHDDPEGFEVIGYGQAHYLEAAREDLSGTYKWGTEGIDIAYTRTELGYGRINTDIIQDYTDDTPAANAFLTLEINGKTDWFLASSEELYLLFENKNLVPGMTESYWSSTQAVQTTDALMINFSGSSSRLGKDSDLLVRPIRAF